MSKFTQIEKGTFVKNGKEYDYAVEIADDFPKKHPGNVRLKIIEERPAIRKIRTRYDPDITLYGDKGTSMELMLGYSMKDLNRAFRLLIYTIVAPFFLAGFLIAFDRIGKLPRNFFPQWVGVTCLILTVILSILFFKFYFKINMTMLAEYLKARDLRKVLGREGFKQKV